MVWEGEQVQQVTAVFYKVLNHLVSRRASPQASAVLYKVREKRFELCPKDDDKRD